MVKFGAWSITLLLGSVHGLIMSGLLLSTRTNRAANRWLAGLLLTVVLLITPFTIGYAGFYDAFPWLTFAPFFWQLGMGPLIYLYVRQLGERALPRGWAWHFVPLAIQVAYYALLFCLPLAAKWQWNDAVHVPVLLPLERCATLLSLVAYLGLASGRYRAYQRWLVDHSAAREEYRLNWLRGFLVASAAALLVAVGFGLTHALVRPLSYFDEFPLYLVFTLLVYYLGLEGWRNAGLRYPQISEAPEITPENAAAVTAEASTESTEPASPERDWPAFGARVRDRVVAAAWWREPELDLSDLARRLGTNSNYLSRALNEGLGMSFSEFINRQRVVAAQRRLAEPGEILAIALEVGFSSKASFNRAFKAYAGCTPSEWRQGGMTAARLSS